MSKLIGTWKLEGSEKFDEYMIAVGVGLVTRKMAGALKPTQVISVSESGTWTIKTLSTFKNTEINFELGKEFDETTGDGRHVKSTITMDGDNKLIHEQKADVPSTLIREAKDEHAMTMTLTAKGVTCTRHYTR